MLTGKDVVRLSAAGKVEWTTPFEKSEWLGRGEFVPVDGGGMVACLYCPRSDSGVRVMRFDPARGGKAWETHCPALGVEHSGYNHMASVEVQRGRVRVHSRGDNGVFEEELDLVTGRSLRRKLPPER